MRQANASSQQADFLQPIMRRANRNRQGGQVGPLVGMRPCLRAICRICGGHKPEI